MQRPPAAHDASRANGKLITPCRSGSAGRIGARTRAARRRSGQGTSLVDLFTAFEDCGKLLGRSINDLLLAGDGIHDNNAGQRLVCELLTRRIAAGVCRL